LTIAGALLAAGAPAYILAQQATVPAEKGQQTINVANADMVVFTYRPTSCTNPSLLMVFHGLHRNADRTRDDARPLAERLCSIIVSPLFDKERFPTWRYQRGGVVDHNVVQPPREWTGRIALSIADWVRKQEARPIAYSMIGHSAGGQFLSRLAAFVPNQAKRIVIANPSTYVFPTLSKRAPYGFGGVYSGKMGEAELRRYLAEPLTIFLGQEDVGDEERSDSAQAVAQGETRYDRGRNFYKAGSELARARGWAFNWRLVELVGVGHNEKKMFASPEAAIALAP
jgi:pimeloyl-ACP methyl ester carboxylesterase